MKKHRKKRLFGVLLIIGSSCLGIGLILYALNSNLDYFLTPSELKQSEEKAKNLVEEAIKKEAAKAKEEAEKKVKAGSIYPGCRRQASRRISHQGGQVGGRRGDEEKAGEEEWSGGRRRPRRRASSSQARGRSLPRQRRPDPSSDGGRGGLGSRSP